MKTSGKIAIGLGILGFGAGVYLFTQKKKWLVELLEVKVTTGVSFPIALKYAIYEGKNAVLSQWIFRTDGFQENELSKYLVLVDWNDLAGVAFSIVEKATDKTVFRQSFNETEMIKQSAKKTTQLPNIPINCITAQCG